MDPNNEYPEQCIDPQDAGMGIEKVNVDSKKRRRNHTQGALEPRDTRNQGEWGEQGFQKNRSGKHQRSNQVEIGTAGIGNASKIRDSRMGSE